MPKIEAFRGVIYNPKKIKIAKAVAPPYDIIPPKMQDELYKLDEHNIVRIELGKEEAGDTDLSNKYTRAAGFFRQWLDEKALIQDDTPALYVYAQQYAAGSKKLTSIGFLGRMKIEDPENSSVKPHENTFAKPKQDRLNLLRRVKANISPIYTLFNDDGKKITAVLKGVFKKKPLFTMRHEGVVHKLWRLDDVKAIAKIQNALADKDVFIADGHHRCEVAGMYRAEMGEGPGGHNYVMTYFAPINQDGLTILATHRLLKNLGMDISGFLKKLSLYFDVKPVSSQKEMFKRMSAPKKGGYGFGVYLSDKKFYVFTLKKGVNPDKAIKADHSGAWKKLDVSILHELVFNDILGLKEKISKEEYIVYTRDPSFATAKVKKGGFEAAFFLNPTKVVQVSDVAKVGDRMPHKSTYFYPKLLSGLVINRLA
ncbi:MAG: DUF1015 domain-containing protein [Candidatus Omnitrophica bacterium]|nr:DUF1015 domain-containing protein [Candidatus Omnitrophota bacterium]